MNKAQLQKLIDDLFIDADEQAERINEYYIVASDNFQTAIENARADLGLNKFKNTYNIDELNIDDWISKNLVLGELNSRVESILNQTGLSKKWHKYVQIYLIKLSPPSTNVFPPNRLVKVSDFDGDSVTIKIHKGIRYDEYAQAWQALSVALGKARRKIKRPDEETRIRDLQMAGKREFYKTTHKELAEEYISGINLDDAKDTVKKALKRQKKLRDEGTNLAQ